MKLIIDIPEKSYKLLQTKDNLSCAECIIANGTPLPKGHGRLIDANDLTQDIIDDSQSCIFNSECERIVHDKMVEFAVDRITYAPTIIEVDNDVSPCANCQEFDCYGCKVKEKECDEE